MRVAYIVKRYPRYSETFIVNEILAHEQAGIHVFIFALLPPQDTHFQDIISKVRAPIKYLSAKAERASAFWETQKKVSQLFPNYWQVLGNFPHASAREILQSLELSLYVVKKRIDHLHAHFATTSTTVAQITSAITGITFTFTAHAKDIFHEDNDFVALRGKFHDAACAITVSDFNTRYLKDDLNISPSDFVRIYNGLDLSQFEYHEPVERAPLICAVGRLVEKKGFSYLLEACRILKTQRVDFRCELIGQGEEEEALHALISELDIADVVTMRGSLPQSEVKQYLEKSAVFAAPCVVGEDGNRDGLPTVLLEAMALGTPCISTDVTGIPEAIIDEKTGLMVRQNDSLSLAEGLKRLLTNGQLRVELAHNARHLIEQHFDIVANTLEIRRCFSKAAITHSSEMENSQ